MLKEFLALCCIFVYGRRAWATYLDQWECTSLLSWWICLPGLCSPLMFSQYKVQCVTHSVCNVPRSLRKPFKWKSNRHVELKRGKLVGGWVKLKNKNPIYYLYDTSQSHTYRKYDVNVIFSTFMISKLVGGLVCWRDGGLVGGLVCWCIGGLVVWSNYHDEGCEMEFKRADLAREWWKVVSADCSLLYATKNCGNRPPPTPMCQFYWHYLFLYKVWTNKLVVILKFHHFLSNF